jgi:hypothetical protein
LQKKEKKIILHQDNAPACKSVLAMGKLRELYYKLLEHAPCSPDLAPSDLMKSPTSSQGLVQLSSLLGLSLSWGFQGRI